jgi:hypothetical protein
MMHDRYDELMARLAALEGLVCSMVQMAPTNAALRDVFKAKTELVAMAAMLAQHGAGQEPSAKGAQAAAMRVLHARVWPDGDNPSE